MFCFEYGEGVFCVFGLDLFCDLNDCVVFVYAGGYVEFHVLVEFGSMEKRVLGW